MALATITGQRKGGKVGGGGGEMEGEAIFHILERFEWHIFHHFAILIIMLG